jgi:hypothetical protein
MELFLNSGGYGFIYSATDIGLQPPTNLKTPDTYNLDITTSKCLQAEEAFEPFLHD